jgi:hypothetical protein
MTEATHPHEYLDYEYREIAALLCQDIENAYSMAKRPNATFDELKGAITMLHHHKEEAMHDGQQRSNRFHALCANFGAKVGGLCQIKKEKP